MNRRDFLSPGHLFHTSGQLVTCLDQIKQELQRHSKPESVALVRMARRAMATQFEVVIPFSTPDAVPMGTQALDRIDQLEAQLSVYKDSSEMTRINRLAAYQPTLIEEGLFGLIQLAKQISKETAGAFDISIGNLIRIWGFLKGPRRVPDAIEIEASLKKVGSKHVHLDPQLRSIYYLVPGLEINLGSIGKGYALDVVGRFLKRQSISHFLAQGGYSSVLASGCSQGGDQGWLVTIRHPMNVEETLGKVWLKNQGLATTANTYQWFECQGKRLGHVLDPRSGWPAEGMASATVIAPTSAEADALSTAFFILGIEAAKTYCQNHPEVSAILLEEGIESQPVHIGQTANIIIG